MKMIAYLEKLKTSYGQRNQIPLPSVGRLIFFVNVLLVVVIILILNISTEDFADYHFREERGAITALSAIFLAIASGLAGSSYYFSENKYKSKRVFWLLNMLGFGFFAWDELMQEHERLGQWIRDSWLGSSQIFRNWNDMVVILYGIAALIFLAYFLPAILSYPKFIEVLAIAFVFYMIHTAIDSITVDITRVSVILEETCKIFSSANFACAMFIGLLGNVKVYCSPKSQ
jgi:hypothetical protein